MMKKKLILYFLISFSAILMLSYINVSANESLVDNNLLALKSNMVCQMDADCPMGFYCINEVCLKDCLLNPEWGSLYLHICSGGRCVSSDRVQTPIKGGIYGTCGR